jgi:pimeloyl-ACP methyl ester carboxylesterase
MFARFIGKPISIAVMCFWHITAIFFRTHHALELAIMLMHRNFFQTRGCTLSYLDTGGRAPVIICLHALWMQASSFQALARRLFPHWRVVALDQRGHGRSSRAADYSRDAFVADIYALIEALKLTAPVVLLGNSLGGTNAFQFAARYPEKVRALIIEEAPAEENMDLPWLAQWHGVFPSLEALATAVAPFYWSVADAVVETAEGFHLAFDIGDMQRIQAATNGDWWADWQASSCPALVLRGANSGAIAPNILEKMASARENTHFDVLDAGHVLHSDNPAAVAHRIKVFLESVA